ncbi:hypothetical protein COW94_04130 [Candidatus Peregrinibacteria bacterium CG22_combo_CG10-13_8_21_14_all_44_10]|nr:MAG: hypothetical protein AUK45_02770 [Candidatus Peregrinibacteria bacterium CG2_30_44_17]PIP66006.1 MAG: hypothetical protein COW94_04130 [Candidatus Peregrinibacteria bacterium CG22_combo_CG10-13_8_21_14_all_44_10]PIX79861.1 MAG: hypothetical protein COZ35_02465 [Candidatus Peregrinibacteria bacterium CG_4_10_14_3_um_filter_44_21]PJB89328.1 MAG: hypothetical protein CO082_01560 [Candidatus Peregrinibacteria bacterium CG_4_9_14_0_8_um_filter_44_15]
MPTVTFSAVLSGSDASIVRVETELARGLPYFVFVGLADTTIYEARDRIKVAIQSSGFDFPRFRKVVNLAPSNIRKRGTQFDLPVAIGLLVASKQLVSREILESSVFVGELGLDGTIRGVPGTLSMVMAAREAGFKRIFVGDDRAPEANLVSGIQVFAPRNLKELVSYIKGDVALSESRNLMVKSGVRKPGIPIKGHAVVQRALKIASLFRHHIVLVGPPGMGKSLLARSAAGLMPPLNSDEICEVVRIQSAFDNHPCGLKVFRPFREVSHTVSVSTLTGGGAKLKAGEMSLAHKGILMLDDLHNFSRAHIEALIKPMEEKSVLVCAGRKKVRMPADFMMIATMNPCLCGKRSSVSQVECSCGEFSLRKFSSKFPAAFWDRVDMVLEVPALDEDDICADDVLDSCANSDDALERQHRRLANCSANYNGELTISDVGHLCKMSMRGDDLMKKALNAKFVSGRGYFNTIKVAQSIADLEGHNEIEPQDVAEALSYRSR